jgi:hypothetical protein
MRQAAGERQEQEGAGIDPSSFNLKGCPKTPDHVILSEGKDLFCVYFQ